MRAEAERRGLRVAHKPDSYDVCFIPDGDTAGYLADRLPTVAGDIVDLDGTVLGTHAGVWRYTVGQRRGLGLGSHERRFVVEVDAVRNRVVVGPREAIACRWADLDDVTWIAGSPPEGPVTVQVRAHGRPVPGRVVPRPAGAGVRVELDEPVHGLARGQSAVVYRDRRRGVPRRRAGGRRPAPRAHAGGHRLTRRLPRSAHTPAAGC